MRHSAGNLLALCLSLSGLAGCVAQETPPASTGSRTPHACLLPAERRMLVAELFFGRDKDGRLVVSDADWSDFLAAVVTAQFPDGLTVFDGYGQWRNPETGVVGRSPHVKIVLIAAKRQPDLATRLATVIDAYKTRFHQQSVGLITRDSCAAF